MNKVSLYIFIILNLTNLNAQLDKKTMAVLNFKGIGINTLEAVTLTDIFNAEITKTNISSLIDRSEVKVSLKNQGLDQSSCLSAECISKVGAALEVELIMTGVINKNNESFNLDIKIFEVSKAMKPLLVTSLVNGEVVIRKKLKEVKMSPLKEKTVSYIGSTDGFINEIEIMAWELMGLNPPEIKVEKQKNIAQVLIVNNNNQYERVIRSALAPGFGQRYAGDKLWGWVWLGSEVVIGTLAYLEFSDYKTSLNNYNKYKSFVFGTATPINDKYQLPSLKHIPKVKIQWDCLEQVNVKYCHYGEKINDVAAVLALGFINGERKGNSHIFINSVRSIGDIIRKMLKGGFINHCDIRIVCADNSRNQNLIETKTSKEYYISPVGSEVKKVNFYTATAFEGCDIYDEEGKTFIVTDGNKDCTKIDIVTVLPQIIGRIRNSRYNNTVDLIYTKNK